MRGMKFAVIGLGQFGGAIAKTLAKRGIEVLVIDKDEQLIGEISDYVASAVALDASDRKALLSVDILDFDAVVVAIGEDFEQLLLTTTLLMDLGVKRIMARARGRNQQLILKKIGVKEILSPEDEVGANVAERLINPSIVSYLNLPGDFCIMEVRTPPGIVGRSLNSLKLRDNYHINLVTTMKDEAEADAENSGAQKQIEGVPTGETIIGADAYLVLFGQRSNIERFIELNT
jgi:trk system potassium uptake protein TrkA